MEPGAPQAGSYTGKYLARGEADFQGTDLGGSRVGLAALSDPQVSFTCSGPWACVLSGRACAWTGSEPPHTLYPPPKTRSHQTYDLEVLPERKLGDCFSMSPNPRLTHLPKLTCAQQRKKTRRGGRWEGWGRRGGGGCAGLLSTSPRPCPLLHFPKHRG